MAIEAKSTLIPLCIHGTDTLQPPGRWWLKPATITLKVLEPVDANHFSGPLAHRELSKLIQKRIQWALDLPVDVDGLVPHQKPMRMIDRLTDLTEAGGGAEARISVDNLFLDTSGKLGKTALLEMMAQAFAATKGHMDRAGMNENILKKAKEGFLVGVRNFNVYQNVMLGDVLNIRVNITKRFGDFVMVKGEIRREKEKIASADIKLWVPETGESGAAAI